jgi:hypothetical protein
MIPTQQQIGCADLETWRVVPADTNPDGLASRSWAIVGGDGDEADVYIDITTEYPKHVAEFILDAVRAHAERLRYTGALGDIRSEVERRRAAGDDPFHPDVVRVAEVVSELGQLAAVVTAQRGRRQPDYDDAVREPITRAAALLVLWLQTQSALPGVEPTA